MPLYLLLSFLLVSAFRVATALPSSSAYRPSNRMPVISADANSLILNAQSQHANQDLKIETASPSYDQHPEITLHGKDDREKEIALCEAGFVPACQSSIEAASSVAGPSAMTNRVHAETLSTIPSIGFYGVSFAVVCIITVIRGCVRGKTVARVK